MQVQKVEKKSANKKERLEAARKDFDKIMKEISPFIKKRGTRVDSTSAGWMITSEQREQQESK
jgi:hypothetical protein